MFQQKWSGIYRTFKKYLHILKKRRKDQDELFVVVVQKCEPGNYVFGSKKKPKSIGDKLLYRKTSFIVRNFTFSHTHYVNNKLQFYIAMCFIKPEYKLIIHIINCLLPVHSFDMKKKKIYIYKTPCFWYNK